MGNSTNFHTFGLCMKWHLDISVPTYPFQIQYSDKLFLIGSCFAENLSEWLEKRHFQVMSNPNGILFNPVSILITLKNILDKPNFVDERFIFEEDGLYRSFLHQTHFYAFEPQTLMQNIQDTQIQARQFLKDTNYLFITFGSAHVYVHQGLGEVVANCHKQPSALFQKRVLSVSEIVQAYSIWVQNLQNTLPNIRIIFSVSPVKYLSDGAVENTISKSVLILSVYELCQQFSNVYYFPAYELITDDLRDYRFYKEDMAHPNNVAVDYVMEKFRSSMLSEESKILVKKLEKVIQSMKHRMMNPYVPQAKKFIETMLQQCENIEKEYPYICLHNEKEYFKSLLENIRI